MSPVETETDSDVIAAAAYAEMDGKTLEIKKEPEAEPVKPVEEAVEVTETPEEKPKEEVPVETPAEEKPAEEAPAEQPADVAPVVEKPAAIVKTEDEIVHEHAMKHNITISEAREDIDKTKSIVRQFKDDPFEIARAYRNTQSAYDKLKAVEAKPKVIIQRDPMIEIKEYAEANRDKIVANYRTNYPAKSSTMEDDVIVEECIQQAARDHQAWVKEEQVKVQKNAADKREQILVSIPEADKRFIPDIKALLSRTPDNQVVSEAFDVNDLVYWARGNHYTPERVKQIEDAAFKRGKEGAVIVGVKTAPATTTSTKKPAVASVGLTEDQKARALDMYSFDDGYTEERSFQMFRETYKEELKKNPKYF